MASDSGSSGGEWHSGIGRDRAILLLVLLAVVLRAAIMLALPQQPVSDALWYLVRAREMAAGMGYQEAGHPTAFWPVGYPALLAASLWLFGPGLAGPMLLNLVAAAASVLLIAAIGRELGAKRPACLIAAALYAIYPASIVYAGQVMSETTSTALALLAFWVTLVGRRNPLALLGAGLLWGLATLMRAQLLLFPAGAIVVIALACRDLSVRRTLGTAVLLHVGLFAAVLPWTARNERMLGAPVLISTNGGIALYTGANDLATGDYMSVEHSPLWPQVGVPWSERVVRQVEMDQRLKAMAHQWIAAHPARWLGLGFRKSAIVWLKDSDAFWSLQASYPAQNRIWRLLAMADQLFYLLVLLLGAGALWPAARRMLRPRGEGAPLGALLAMPLFVTVTAFGFSGQIRYHYPAMPFMLIAAGVAVQALARRGRPAEAAVPELAPA